MIRKMVERPAGRSMLIRYAAGDPMTPTLWDHGISIAPQLIESLCSLERRGLPPWIKPSAAAQDRLADAIAVAWRKVIDDASAGRAGLSAAYVSGIHHALAATADTQGPGEFADDGESDCRWSAFLADLSRMDVADEFDSSFFKYACVLSILASGGHVKSVSLSLGWLCMNGLLLTDGQAAIYPPSAHHDRLLRAMHGAGPDHWDPETLRFVLSEYAKQQASGRPSPGGPAAA